MIVKLALCLLRPSQGVTHILKITRIPKNPPQSSIIYIYIGSQKIQSEKKAFRLFLCYSSLPYTKELYITYHHSREITMSHSNGRAPPRFERYRQCQETSTNDQRTRDIHRYGRGEICIERNHRCDHAKYSSRSANKSIPCPSVLRRENFWRNGVQDTIHDLYIPSA